VVELAMLRPKARFYISQALPIGDLGKGHGVILVETCKFFDFVVAVVAIHALAKDMERKKLHHLRKNHFSGIHD
jgi:hypothetical protein